MIERWMLACSLASSFAWCAWSTADPQSAPAKAVAATAALAIGERCKSCHPDLVRTYRETGMANALGPLVPGELAGLASVPDAQTGYSYVFEQDAAHARIVESWSAPARKGATSSSSSVRDAHPLAFAVGAGLLDRSFVALSGELMFFAPLEVLTTPAGARAVLAPGHAIQPGTRFTTPISEECLSCHTDRLPARDYPLNLRPDAAHWQPQGIDCGACHQRAAEHAAWREQDLAATPQSGADPLVVHARDDALASMSSCARCHLQGDARIALRPGERGVPPPTADLLEQRAIFVSAQQTAEIGFVSQVERLVRSRCYLESLDDARTLTCTSCHDPHRSSFDAAERTLVRSKCLACHSSGERADALHGQQTAACALKLEARGQRDCVSCHMRLTPVFDVDSVKIHDHFIEKQPPPPSPRSKLRTKETLDGKLALFTWPGRVSPKYVDDPGLWMLASASAGRPDLALPFAERGPGPVADALPMFHHVRASLLESRGRLEEARRSYERALRLDPAQAESAVNLGALLGKLGKPEEGIKVLERVIAAHPRAEGALRNRALLELDTGDQAGFARDLEAAYAIAPLAPVARALQQHYLRQRDAERAAQWFARARRLDPAQE